MKDSVPSIVDQKGDTKVLPEDEDPWALGPADLSEQGPRWAVQPNFPKIRKKTSSAGFLSSNNPPNPVGSQKGDDLAQQRQAMHFRNRSLFPYLF
ncbi:hypothetical protein TNCV_3918081 [Trichonephila clavipes]|nr:hypothetical protein TNCV_3918081 [Trichonephila clavipes]